MFSGDRGTELMLLVASSQLLSLPHSNSNAMKRALFNECALDEGLFLDVVDATLRHVRVGGAAEHVADKLRRTLAAGFSVWTVAPDHKRLERVASKAAAAAMRKATEPDDIASAELQTAWTEVYGLKPDASDAWDHAIKAVEAVYIPLVVPKQSKPNLGHVIGHLASQGHLWRLAIEHGEVSTLVGMLNPLWPNPDRHGASPDHRDPSDEEARALVHLAVQFADGAAVVPPLRFCHGFSMAHAVSYGTYMAQTGSTGVTLLPSAARKGSVEPFL